MDTNNSRHAALQISKEDFQKTEYYLVNRLADFYDTIASSSVTTGETPNQIRAILGNDHLPENGSAVYGIFESNRYYFTGGQRCL